MQPQTQAIEVKVVDREPEGRIKSVQILNRTVQMDDLIGYAKKTCPDCGPYHGTKLQGTYQQQGKDGKPFLNLCGCTVKRYVKRNQVAMASELKPQAPAVTISDPAGPPSDSAFLPKHVPLPVDTEALARKTSAGELDTEAARGGEAATIIRPLTRHEIQAERLTADLARAQDDLQAAEARHASRMAGATQQAEREVERLVNLRLAQQQDTRAGELLARELEDRKLAVVLAEQQVEEAKAKIRTWLEGRPARESEVQAQALLVDQAESNRRVQLAREEGPVVRARKEVERIERRLAAARIRAG
jgi:hypothetical protein